jgi:phosphatidylserine decarboxylase
MPKVRFAPEGWLFIIPFIVLAAAALLIQWYVAAILFSAIAAFLLNFFRDPHRTGSGTHVDVLSPADGYNAGKKIVAMSDKASSENEQNLVVIADERGGTVSFKQIAGLLARRIVFDKKEGDTVSRGERVGMIKLACSSFPRR